MTKLKTGLILEPAQPDEWQLGSGLASEKFGSEEINPSADWTPYRSADEAQSIPFVFDTMGCVPFASLKAWAMLARFHSFKEFPLDMSERYTGTHGGVTRTGSNPHHVAEVTRKTAGAIPQSSMPWTPDITTHEAYYDRAQAMANLPFGKKLLDRYELGHEWIFAFGSSYTPEEKAERIRAALRRGTVCVSVRAWRKKGKLYTKKPSERDGHWVTALRYDGDNLVIHDQYDPYEKTLTANYNHDAAKVYFLKERTEERRSFWSVIWDLFANRQNA